nr:uncharacterized mitochondrial protein AtMg00810-like [Tanacetum cinerariifolium]
MRVATQESQGGMKFKDNDLKIKIQAHRLANDESKKFPRTQGSKFKESIHSEEWKSFQSQHQTALRIRRWRYNLIPAESKFKTLCSIIKDKYMMKAQVNAVISKASRVFNTKTRKVEENLHVRFLENKPNIAGTGPNWIFDIDSLTNYMNYIPVSAGNQTNKNAGPQDTIGNAEDALRKEFKQGCMHQRGVTKAGSTNSFNTVSNPVNTASTLRIFSADGPSSPHPDALIHANTLLHIDQDDSQIPNLEDTVELQSLGIFNSAYDDDLDKFTSLVQSVGAEADFNNIELPLLNKKDKRGIVVRNKARLVVQGHRQEEGIDYDKVFAHVARIKAIRIFLACIIYGIYCLPNGCQKCLLIWNNRKGGVSSTPIETQKPFVKDEEDADIDVHLYRSMIGSLMHLMASRPDIMFAVCACSRFQVTPKLLHLQAVKMIFRYLKGQPKLGLWYPKDSPFDMDAYSNSDYAGANLDRKSTIGGCQFLARRLISGQCNKQTIVATSTTEAKYVAAANCCGQDKVITRLKLRVKRLEKKRKARTSQPMKRRLFKGKVETSTDKILGEDASKQGRNNDKTEELNLTDGADTEVIVEYKGSSEKVGSTDDQVSTARPETLIKLRSKKAKEKGIAFKDADDSTRPIRSITTLQPLPTIDLKDKGKGVLVEEEPKKLEKVKRRDQWLAQIESDADLAQRIYEEELSELGRAQKERQNQEEATIAALIEEFDEIQARIDADHELAVRMTHEEQEKYTIEERTRLLAKYFERRKKQLVAKRAEAIRNKPPKRTQVRNRMITYLKHIDSKKEEKKSVEPESKGKKRKRIKRITDSALKQKSSKKQKMVQEQESADYEHENEKLRMWLTVVSDKEENVKKAPAKAARSKGIDFLSEAALLEEAQLKKAIKRSKQETKSWGDSGDEANVKGDDEYVQDIDDEPQQADDERTDSKNQETNDDEKETDDEIDKELNGEVNVRLTDDEQDVEDQEDVDMTNVAHVQVEQTQEQTMGVHEESGPEMASVQEATTSTIDVPDSETLTTLHQRTVNLEKDVKELKDIDNSTKVISTIKYEVPNTVKEYLGSSMDDALHNKTTLFETMTKYKSLKTSPKHKSLYHTLMESIIEDEEAMDEGVAEKLKKRKSDDVDKDKGKSLATSSKSSKSGKSTKDHVEEPIFVQDFDYAEHDDADMPRD